MLLGLCLVWSTASRALRLEKRQITAGLARVAGAAISPKGDKVAIFVADGTKFPTANHLEIHDISSLKIDATIDLPRTNDLLQRFRWSEAVSRVHYCDHGKYILVNLGDGVSSVVNAQSGATATIKLDQPAETRKSDLATLIAASCAAEADLAVFDVVSDSQKLNHIELFNLEDGKQIKELSGGHTDPYIYMLGVEVSPSGNRVVSYATRVNDPGSPMSAEIRVVDVSKNGLLRSINVGFPIGQAAFLGESSVAVVGEFYAGTGISVAKIFNLESGALTSSIGDARHPPIAEAGASTDGRLLFAYTGKENNCADCNVHSRGSLQIQAARFTVWNLATGKVIAQSPNLHALTTHAGILGEDMPSHSSERPRLQFSQSGNAVLVMHTRKENAISVFLLQ